MHVYNGMCMNKLHQRMSCRLASPIQVFSYVGAKENRENLRSKIKSERAKACVVLTTYEVRILFITVWPFLYTRDVVIHFFSY